MSWSLSWFWPVFDESNKRERGRIRTLLRNSFKISNLRLCVSIDVMLPYETVPLSYSSYSQEQSPGHAAPN